MEKHQNDSDSYAGGLFEDDSDESDDMMYYQAPKGTAGCNLAPGGPQRPNTEGFSEKEAQQTIKDWRILRKKFTDGVVKLQREKKSNAPVDATTIVQEKQYSGVLVESLRLMEVVADSPMAVDHTYPSKEIVNIELLKKQITVDVQFQLEGVTLCGYTHMVEMCQNLL